jgi:hypothetical protein
MIVVIITLSRQGAGMQFLLASKEVRAIRAYVPFINIFIADPP